MLNLIASFGLLLMPFLFRKRLLRWISNGVIAEIWNHTFEETTAVDESGTKTRKLTLKPQARGVLGVVTPAVVQEAIKGLKIRLPQFAPVNLATGELDFMAPLLAKAAAGKKLSVEDAIPFILSKAEPMLNQLFGGLAGFKKKPTEPKELQNPFLVSEVK